MDLRPLLHADGSLRGDLTPEGVKRVASPLASILLRENSSQFGERQDTVERIGAGWDISPKWDVGADQLAMIKRPEMEALSKRVGLPPKKTMAATRDFLLAEFASTDTGTLTLTADLLPALAFEPKPWAAPIGMDDGSEDDEQ